MSALTIASVWINAVLDGLVREGLERAALTQGLRGVVDGRAPDAGQIEVGLARRIWRRARALSDDPLLGLKVGSRLPMQAANVVSVVRAHSGTFEESLRHMARYQVLLSDSGRFMPTAREGGLRLTYEPSKAAVGIDPLQIDSVVGAAAGRRPRPVLVQLVGRAEVDPAPFADLLGCPVRMGAAAATIDFDAAALATPIPGADPALRDLNLAYAESMLAGRRRMDGLRQNVRAAIGKLGPGAADVPSVAAEVGCSPRTLQRRLAQAGTSFKALLEGYRMEEALILLVESQASVAQISRLLGYSQTSAFSRAVSHWWGASPRALRQARGVGPLR